MLLLPDPRSNEDSAVRWFRQASRPTQPGKQNKGGRRADDVDAGVYGFQCLESVLRAPREQTDEIRSRLQD